MVAAWARAVGVDLVRFQSTRHPVGRRAQLMRSLSIDLVIDIGANRGQFAHEIRRAGYRGRILSIEPLEEPYLELSRSAAKDSHWTAVRSAVGAGAGVASIHVAANGGASSSLLPMLDLHRSAAPEANYVGEERVEVRTLDSVAQPHRESGDRVFMKIDVQGFELQVLEGGPETLSGSSMVQVEMSLIPLYEGAPTYEDVLAVLGRKGLQLVGIEPGIADRSGMLLQMDGLFVAEDAVRMLQGVRP
jgi:FkbM family methyltransferase